MNSAVSYDGRTLTVSVEKYAGEIGAEHIGIFFDAGGKAITQPIISTIIGTSGSSSSKSGNKVVKYDDVEVLDAEIIWESSPKKISNNTSTNTKTATSNGNKQLALPEPPQYLGLPEPTNVETLPNSYLNAGLVENKPTIFLNTPVIKTASRGGYQIVEFTNPSGIVLEFGAIQTQKTINISIESALNSKNSGKAIEGKVADFIQKETNEEVIRFGTKVNRLTGIGKAGEIDIETKNQIIEVKKSASVIDKSQIDKLTQINHKDFFNYEKKEVIIYVDEPIDMNNPYIRRDVEYARENGIKIINSLEELKKEIK